MAHAKRPRRKRAPRTPLQTERLAELAREEDDARDRLWARIGDIRLPPASDMPGGAWRPWADDASARGEINADAAMAVACARRFERYFAKVERQLAKAMGFASLLPDPDVDVVLVASRVARHLHGAWVLLDVLPNIVVETIAAALTPRKVERERKSLAHDGAAQRALRDVAKREGVSTERPWERPADMHNAFAKYSTESTEVAKRSCGVWEGSYCVNGVRVKAKSIDGAARKLELLRTAKPRKRRAKPR